MFTQDILEELKRRQKLRTKTILDTRLKKSPSGIGQYIRQHLFDKQLQFNEDDASKKAALCTRRAGKTEDIAADLFADMEDYPGSIQAYFAPQKASAVAIMWPKLQRLKTHYDINCTMYESTHIVKHRNGSMIYLFGADTPRDLAKALGLALFKVVFDEAGSYGVHFRSLIEDILEPTLADYGGKVILIGTPQPQCQGYFYEITREELELRQPGWSVHNWSVFDNPYFPQWLGRSDWKEYRHIWFEKELARLGKTIDDPVIQRSWFGRWVRDNQLLVYKYTPGKNDFDHFPHNQDWKSVVAIDLGDNTAFSLLTYASDWPLCYIRKSYNSGDLSTDDIGEHCMALWLQHPEIRRFVIDTGGLGDKIMQDLQTRYKLPMVAAQKRHKAAYQKTMNSDFERGRLLVNPKECVDLINEMSKLILIDGEEDPNGANHCCDTALYGWRECRYNIRGSMKDDTSVDVHTHIENEHVKHLLQKRQVAEMDQLEALLQ